MIWFILLIIIILIGAYLYFGIKNGDKAQEFLWEELKKYNVDKSNIKLTIGNYIPENCFIYSKDKQLFYANHRLLKLDKIEFDKILDIIIESEYNAIGEEISTIFRIVTEDKVYYLSTNCGYKNAIIQLKAILEKEMNEI